MATNLPIRHVPLDSRRGAFKPCMWCGGEHARFEPAPLIEPSNPEARVICEVCNRQIAWANARQVRKATRLTSNQGH